MKRLITLILGLAVMGSGCTGARHIAVTVDATLVSVVLAIDEAEFQACKTHVIMTPEQCAVADPKIKQALIDARAVTQAIKDSPKNTLPPTSLSGLLQNLTAAQAIIGDLSPGPLKTSLTISIVDAIGRALTILKQFTIPAGA